MLKELGTFKNHLAKRSVKDAIQILDNSAETQKNKVKNCWNDSTWNFQF
jgi:hypothetical protein